MRSIFAVALMAGVAAIASAQTPQPAPPAGGAPMMARPHHERFDADANHDGYLSRDEALAAAEARFKRLDANGDGKLTAEEFTPHGPRGPWTGRGQGPGAGAPGGPPEGGPPQAGALTGWRKEAMEEMMGKMREREKARFDNVLAEWDKNHDGAIELAEFRAQALARFNAMDGNRDGKVKLPEHMGGPEDGWRGGMMMHRRMMDGGMVQGPGWKREGEPAAPPAPPAKP